MYNSDEVALLKEKSLVHPLNTLREKKIDNEMICLYCNRKKDRKIKY